MTRSLRIGMDLDGVVCDYVGAVLSLRGTGLTAEYCTEWNSVVDLAGFDSVEEMYAWREQEYPYFFQDEIQAYPAALMALQHLKEEGHELVIITSRPWDAKHQTREWLEDVGIDYDELHVTQDKPSVPTCDVYLDDAPHHLRALRDQFLDVSGGPTVVRWLMPWNGHVAGVLTAFTWTQFRRIVRSVAETREVPEEPANEPPPEDEIAAVFEARREGFKGRGLQKMWSLQMNPEATVEDIEAHFGESSDSADTGSDEIRVTNPVTGAEKGQKPARFDLIPALPLADVARHYGIGARKYEDRNWERGYNWSLSFGAIQRHLWAFWDGEDLDPDADTTTTHLAAVVFHALALMEFMETHPELDDRPRGAFQ